MPSRIFKCLNCDNEVKELRSGSKQKFCTRECFQLNKNKQFIRVTKQCPKCQKSHEKDGIYCSRTCANGHGPMSNEQKEVLRLFAKANPKGAILDPDAGNRGRLTRSKKTQSKRISRLCPCGIKFDSPPSDKRIHHNRECAKEHGAFGGYRQNSTNLNRSIYKEQKMDSGAEKAFAMLLDEHSIMWKKNTSIFFEFIDLNGKPRKYYPDFYLPEYDFWIEIKGKKYIRSDDNLRLQAVGSNIQLIMSDDIRLPDCIKRNGAMDGNQTRLGS